MPSESTEKDAATSGDASDAMSEQDAAAQTSRDAGVIPDDRSDAGNMDAAPPPPPPVPMFSNDPGPIDTAIVHAPVAPQTDGSASRFEFACNRSQCRFEYSLDGSGFATCASELTFQTLPVGSHELRVRALDEAGKTDDSPASFSWSTDFAFRALASSAGSSCAISNEGKLYCWGSDEYGSVFGLGTMMTVREAAPRRIGDQQDWRAIVGADYGYCATNAANEVYCWGSGPYGDEMVSNTNVTSPARTALPSRSLSFGSDHGCGLDASGHLWCWGENSDNQLGVDIGEESTTPVQVGDKVWSMVSAGAYNTCAIDDRGELYCFGDNSSGESGVDPNVSESVSTPTRVGSDSNWQSVSCADAHCCGLKNDHTLYCWGTNWEFDLGIGELPTRTHEPHKVGNDNWQVAQVIEEGGCATKLTGASYCWGPNARAELGNTTVLAEHSSIPARMSTDQTIEHFTGSYGHRCGLAAGKVLCWGDNQNADGALGRGVFGQEPRMVKVDSGWARLSVTRSGGCGVRDDGALQCWGVGGYVAAPDVPLRYAPTEVDASRDWSDVAVSSAVDGNAYACGLRAGGIHCWGSNLSGRLGDGSGQTQKAPVSVDVAPGLTFEQLSVGEASACAITSAGHLYCWGSNNYGQIGDGTTTQRATPVQVQSPSASGWRHVSVMSGRVSAIREDGTLWAWGSNSHGASNSTPTRLGMNADWLSTISTYQNGTCAINSAHALACTVQTFSDSWARALSSVSEINDVQSVFDAINGICLLRSDASQQCMVDHGSGWQAIARPEWTVASDVTAADFVRWTGGYGLRCALTSSGDRYCSGPRFSGSYGDGMDERLPTTVLLPQ